MKKIKRNMLITVVVIIFLLFVGYMSGYRFDGLSAAKANAFVPKDSILLDEVKYGWGSVYIFNSSEKPVTAISIKTLGFLWSSRMSSYHYHREDPVQTIGGVSLNNPREKSTVISILVKDPEVSYLEVGPEGNRVTKESRIGEPITFAWDEAVQLDRLYPKAFDKNGNLLYEYRYAISNFTRQEDLRWYPTDQ
jgi:hypothetical protein